MGNARLLAITAAAAFIFYNLLGTTNDVRQPAVATSPKQKSVGRILLYITTHMSTTHFWYLDTCWPEALLRSSLLREADVLDICQHPNQLERRLYSS